MPRSPLDPKTALGWRFRAIRTEVGIPTQAAMARWLSSDDVPIDKGRYSHWEAGDHQPSPVEFLQICKRAKLPMEYVVKGQADGLPLETAIRLVGREMGMNPDHPEFDEARVIAAIRGAKGGRQAI